MNRPAASMVALALVCAAGCASRGKPEAAGGHGFVRGRLGTQDVDMSGPLMQTQVHLNPAFSFLMLAPSMNRPTQGTPVTLSVVFRGKKPGQFRVISRDTTDASADEDVAQVMVHVARRKWASVDGELRVTAVQWSGKDLRRLAGTYRGNMRSPDEQVLPCEVTFSYE